MIPLAMVLCFLTFGALTIAGLMIL
jgi:hypothetical protein